MKILNIFWILWSEVKSRRRSLLICYILLLVICTASMPERPFEYPYSYSCPSNIKCEDLPAVCLECEFPSNCEYGQGARADCKVKSDVKCEGDKLFKRAGECKYCWQTENHVCKPLFNCSVWAAPTQQLQKTVCWANDSVVCMGSRTFYKRVRCNWTSGYKWSTALVLSITLGGFGADRFYLGLWQSGLGKLFSFGGVGVWTLIDVILIGTGYIGPADKSVYMP